MDRLGKTILISLASTSALTWIVSGVQQDNMMIFMSSAGGGSNISVNPIAVVLFTAIWTAGMAAMMFPAISPMVLLYNRLVNTNGISDQQAAATIFEQKEGKTSSRAYPLKTILFVGCYLLIWALTGIGLLIGWSLAMESVTATFSSQASQNNANIILYGAILIISGAYQFSPLKNKCLGYCESPMSFFMRRWRDGASGAVKMGLYHGVYCLGCCWTYFLIMVALGWMNLLWMGLFSAIIFGEKMWSKGIWVARAAGVALAIAGILVIAGQIPSILTPGDHGNGGMSSMPMTKNDDMSDNDNNSKMADSRISNNDTPSANAPSIMSKSSSAMQGSHNDNAMAGMGQ